MIFFEVFNELDERINRLIKAIDPLMNMNSRYMVDGNCLVILGNNISFRVNFLTREVNEEKPYRNFDFSQVNLYWFSEESAEGAMIRMMINAFRQWYGIDAFKTFAEFERAETDINRQLSVYGLYIKWTMDKMEIFDNDEIISFETAVSRVIEADTFKQGGLSIDEWLNDARYFRKTDQLERAIELYERIKRFSNYMEREYTESVFCLGESYYFLGDTDKAVAMYYQCNLDYIEDENDFFIHIGHALLDVKMKHFERELRIYYRGCLDRSYAMEHIREIERAAAEIGEEFAAYEETCLIIGRKKYEEQVKLISVKPEVIDQEPEVDEKPVDDRVVADNRYSDIRLVRPDILVNSREVSLNDSMAKALGFLGRGEYQRAYEVYYMLSQSLDPESDYATWVNFQLGKLYCFCDDVRRAYKVLKKCRPGKFGVVYRQSDYFILYTHVRILCDDFESDERFRRLIRGKFDAYYAKYDEEYIRLRHNAKIMKMFGRYEKECLQAARNEFNLGYKEEKKKRRNIARSETDMSAGISKYFE
ncbi:MAG: hypothetical protein K6E98_10565 [Lachnospiraceae bacterium]|nr:hypothetical protein [Lachnospiraceae bacterium]